MMPWHHIQDNMPDMGRKAKGKRENLKWIEGGITI